jgi:signal transduction histidine kinase
VFAAVLVAVVVVLTGSGISLWVQARLVADEREAVSLRLAPYANAVSVAINRRVGRVNALKAFVEAASSRAEVDKQFPVFAAGLREGASGIRALQLITGGFITHVYPDSGNVGIRGFDVRNSPSPEVRAEVGRTEASMGVVIGGPRQLMQGGRGFIARQRIHARVAGLPEVAAVVLDEGAIFDVAAMAQGIPGLTIAVLDRHDSVFYPAGATQPDRAVAVGISAPDGNWTLAAAPREGWEASVVGPVWGVRFATLLVALLAAGFTFVTVGRQRHLARSVQRRTADLRRANEELQREVQEREAAQAALRRHEEALMHRQKMQAVGTLAGGVAHDFNNVLTAIIGYGRLARDRAEQLPVGNDAAAREAVRADLDEVLRAAEHAAMITNQLLLFSRQGVERVGPIDVQATLVELEALLHRLLGERIEVAVQLAPDLPTILADKGGFAQLLMNVATNARDAMPQGGTFTVAVDVIDVSPDDPLTTAGMSSGRYVRVGLSDTGSGMPPEVLARAFEPFFTTKGLANGTGLGLSTVYGIAARAGGRVDATSVPGVGTTITVLLPAGPPVVAGRTRAVAPVAATSNGETILVVEDEDAVRSIVTRVLARSGYHVISAEHAHAALTLVDSFTSPIALMLTDIVMPGMNGHELAATMRQRRPDTRILFMSGYSAEADRFGDEDGSVQTLLSKPFTPDELVRRVRAALALP